MKNKVVLNICLSGIFLGLAMILPFLTGQIQEIGSMLCPLHLPVLICGYVCGWKYGLIVGLISPVLRSVIFGMPSLYPASISMSIELALYGFTSGLLYDILKRKNLNSYLIIYVSLIVSLLIGRLGWGLLRYILGLIDQTNVFTFDMFISGAFVMAWPGIILQIVLIPVLIKTLEKIGYLN